MYISEITIENFRCFGEGDDRFVLPLRPGLTALVGKNEAGKTAVIDALRFALGTTDNEWYRLEDSDFFGGLKNREIRIVCKFEGLNANDQRAFVEYLTYGGNTEDELALYLNWTAKDVGENHRRQAYRRGEVHSGRNGSGPTIAADARDLLRATFLRPLRDAEQSLSAGRGSRLAQVLRSSHTIQTGQDEHDPDVPLKDQELSVLGIGNLLNALLESQKEVTEARDAIDQNLERLSLRGDSLKSDIEVGGATASADMRLRELLEKLDLHLDGAGKLGLGSDNLLFIACELLLLDQENEGNKLLLIEEPEVHLDAQRQLRVMTFLQSQAKEKGIQAIVTTHSPNLASAIDLDNMVMIHKRRAFSLARGETELEPSDYAFLKRFLDATKANLFFARGVVIVEGDAENILLPTLAKLLGRDFTENGVSIVNVGSVGLRRFARIFQRKGVKATDKHVQLAVPVACITDLDIMPDCARDIMGKDLRTKSELGDAGLKERRERLWRKASGQCVETFVSDEWTLEYDLAYFGLAEDVYITAELAKKEETLASKPLKDVVKAAEKAQQGFNALEKECRAAVSQGKANGSSYKELLATKVYSQFTTGTKASKAIAAQYLAGRLWRKHRKRRLTAQNWRALLPSYLTAAIDYVTNAPKPAEGGATAGGLAHEEPTAHG